MLTITLISVSHKQPKWVQEAYEDYAKRLPARDMRLVFKELKPEARDNRSIESAMRLEAEKIQEALPKSAYVIALDERGQEYSSVGLASQLQRWQEQHTHIAIIIGGADGLDAAFKAQCRQLMRLSAMTLPHGLVRVVLAEQLYRAYSINCQHPYHRV